MDESDCSYLCSSLEITASSKLVVWHKVRFLSPPPSDGSQSTSIRASNVSMHTNMYASYIHTLGSASGFLISLENHIKDT